MHHLSREIFRDGESHDVHRSPHIADDPAHLSASEAAGLCPQTQHNLVAVDGVNIEVDRRSSATRGGQPVQQRLAGWAELLGAERADAPLRDVRVVIFGPGVQPDQRDPLWRHDGREQGQSSGSPWPVNAATAIA